MRAKENPGKGLGPSTLGKIVVVTLLGASGAFANDDLPRLREHASELETQFADIHAALRCPLDDCEQFEATKARMQLFETTPAIDRMRGLAARVERDNIALASRPDWSRIRQLITLVDGSHAEKLHLMAGSVRETRNQLEALAATLTRRAGFLRQGLDRLLESENQRNPGW